MKKTTVELGKRRYDILIGENILEGAAQYICPILRRPRTVIITDDNVAQHQLKRLEKNFENNAVQFNTIILPAGEATKSLTMFETLLDQLLGLRLERSDMIIALGGRRHRRLGWFCGKCLFTRH